MSDQNIRGTMYAEPEFITIRGASRERGRLELAFGHIGASYLLGGAFGVVGGLFSGFQGANQLGLQGRLLHTHMLNHVLKRSTAWAQVAGTLTLLYSLAGVALMMQRGHDDDLTTIGAATVTGTIYQAPAGPRKCLIGGLFGCGIASTYCLWSHRRDFTEYITRFARNQQTKQPSLEMYKESELLDLKEERIDDYCAEIES